MVALTDARPIWDFSLSLSCCGRPEDLRSPDEAWPLLSENRIDLMHRSLSEWYIDSPKRLEHSLEIVATGEPDRIVLEFALKAALTPKIVKDGRSSEFSDASGAPVLVYRDLRGLDAERRDLDVRWEKRAGATGEQASALRLVVEGADHAYPPWLTSSQ